MSLTMPGVAADASATYSFLQVGATTMHVVADVPTLDLPVVDASLPCQVTGTLNLWFAEGGDDVERAKVMCAQCPLRVPCLDGALARREPWGVWGGEVFVDGSVVARKRGRGRPRKVAA